MRSSYLHIDSSTITDNRAGNSGGGLIAYTSDVKISNSTISDNLAYVANGSGMVMTLINNPILLNSTIQDDIEVVLGGPVLQRLSLQNTIINGSCQGGDSFIDNGGNIFLDGSCNGNADGDPGLRPLANNGGPTPTHALSEDSIARGAGDATTCTVLDQRGNVRDEGDNACDAGSFEFLPRDVPANFFSIPLSDGTVITIPL